MEFSYGFMRKITHKRSIFQHAMFDYWMAIHFYPPFQDIPKGSKWYSQGKSTTSPRWPGRPGFVASGRVVGVGATRWKERDTPQQYFGHWALGPRPLCFCILKSAANAGIFFLVCRVVSGPNKMKVPKLVS